MKKVWKFIRTWCLSFAVTFYLAFVLKMLWDWFVTAAFHVGEIDYWNMYGLILVATVLSIRTFEMVQAQQWIVAKTMLEACVPEDKREETTRQIKEQTLSDELAMGVTDGMRALTATYCLVGGWIVHALFM